MLNEYEERLARLEEKINATYTSVEKLRKIFLVIVWITVLGFAIPAIGLMFAIPSFIDTYTTGLDGLL